MKKYIIKLCLLLVFPLTIMNISCSNLLDQTPEIAVTSKNVWTSEYDAMKVVNSMYLSMRGGVSFRWWFGDLRAQEFSVCTDYNLQHIMSNMLPLCFRGFMTWSGQYKTIAYANLIIDNVDKVDVMSETKRNYNKGCAHFMRAYNYFEILQYFGEAPLCLQLDDMNVGAKSSKAEVFEQIIRDLKEAERLIGNLTFQTLSTAITGLPYKTKLTPTKGTVHALMAQVYAWQGSLTANNEYLNEAVSYATKVITSGEFKLADNYEDVCNIVMNGNSDEGIFEVEYSKDERNGATNAFYLISYPIVNGRSELDFPYPLNTFKVLNSKVEQIYDESEDKRLNSYFHDFYAMKAEFGSRNENRPYFKKWRNPSYSASSAITFLGLNSNEIICRLPDIILLRAEINNRLGNTAAAETDLNTIRERAGLKRYDASLHGSLKLAILKERHRELYMECHRMTDLIRNAEVRNMLPSFKDMTDTDIMDGCYYLPVDPAAFTKNPQMRQNIYWKNNGY